MRNNTQTNFIISVEVAQIIRSCILDTFGHVKLNLDTDADLIADASSKLIGKALDTEFLKAIDTFKSGQIPFLNAKGFKIDPFIGATPPTGNVSPNSCPITVIMQLGLLKLCGFDPMAYRFENQGKIQRNVVPVANNKSVASSQGFNVNFPWHTDNPSGDPSPRVLCFVGIRNLERIPTEILPLRRAIPYLPQQVMDILVSRRFLISPPPSNDYDAPSLVNSAILFEQLDGWEIRFDSDCISPTDKEDGPALMHCQS